MKESIALPISEDSQVGEARRLAVAMSIELGFDTTEQGKVAIVVTEAAKNLVKHAKHGEILIQSIDISGATSIEMIAIDSAPGIQNIAQSLQDGFSTTGTSGTGLGAIQRLSTQFDIYSQPQVGTVLIARLESKRDPPTMKAFEIGAVNLPKHKDNPSGDAWAIEQQHDRCLILVADGLGSGTLAAEASQAAIRVFQINAHLSPQQILEKIHAALRSTRGAVAAIAEIIPSEQQVRYAGIGNISATLLTGSTSRTLISYNGTLGLTVRKVAELSYPWSNQSILVMHSDGLGTQWTFDRYPGLLNRHPALIAAILYRDFRRPIVRNSIGLPDDVAVLVAKPRNEDL
ncbi:SpoIIE family protein phosphatase [Leptolyngbya sp. NIES-2104]|uniref:SpoIIE family protein phosphatase n=1 Tax=Leptolyngbya sp. NIES-2104 TaxID=1552121 RepID=UPI0006EC86A6|nr:SpoIIE family protein phosphatase [Leptolyngbya sp. NIES-2104]GAP96958.1 anti-sigma B factor RsbT / Phosphoserine phosphatase RsbX [Leptolyngbya sp. NIES-2104]